MNKYISLNVWELFWLTAGYCLISFGLVYLSLILSYDGTDSGGAFPFGFIYVMSGVFFFPAIIFIQFVVAIRRTVENITTITLDKLPLLITITVQILFYVFLILGENNKNIIIGGILLACVYVISILVCLFSIKTDPNPTVLKTPSNTNSIWKI